MVEIIPNWHPLFVHFTVALLSISVVLFTLTKLVTDWRLEDQWLATAYWNLWIGVAISVVTVIAGFIAFNSVGHDTPSHVAMLDHRLWALLTFALFFVMAIWAVIQYRSEKNPTTLFICILLVGLFMLSSTAWRGGELVYRHGLGVMSLPDKDDHGHAEGAQEHEHGNDSEQPEEEGHSDGRHGEEMQEKGGHGKTPGEALESPLINSREKR
ncbi:MAG: DUF2231 domain-containing protein [Gammaproteobacteria bacterium]|nr:DUF2231 domain-containing protein [Gammaproteobacteria bacterium]